MKSYWCVLGVLAYTASAFGQGTGTIHGTVTESAPVIQFALKVLW
jgi:hypothetical protein